MRATVTFEISEEEIELLTVVQKREQLITC